MFKPYFKILKISKNTAFFWKWQFSVFRK